VRVTTHICRLLIGALALVAACAVLFIIMWLLIVAIPAYPAAAGVIIFLVSAYTSGSAWIK